MKAKINKVNISIVQGDIMTQVVDAIVVVTDPNLTVDPFLAKAGGPTVEEEAKQIGWCEVGAAVMTGAGTLPNAGHIIHAVGPRWGEGSERGKLANVTWASLELVENAQLRSIALPAISVGTLGYPLENCATIMLTRIIDYTFEDLKYLRSILLCLPHQDIFNIFKSEFERQIHDLRQTGEGQVRA